MATWTTWTATSASSLDIWPTWVSTTSSTATTSTIISWQAWCDSDDSYGTIATAPGIYTSTTPQRHEPSEEELQQMRERDARFHAEAAARAAVARLARRRARLALLTNLNKEQRRSWKAKQHFVVHGRSGTRYRINPLRPGNVDVINRDGFIQERLCFHCHNLPEEDNLLAQKLFLEADDAGAVKIANKHGVTSAMRAQRVLPAL